MAGLVMPLTMHGEPDVGCDLLPLLLHAVAGLTLVEAALAPPHAPQHQPGALTHHRARDLKQMEL